MTSDKSDAAAKSQDFVISRVVDAPRDLVWKCFTEAEHMKVWSGPKEFRTVKATMDLRPGGTYHYGMKALKGSATMWGKAAYREIVAPERLVYLNSFSDETGGTTRHPRHSGWPLELLTIITFEEVPGGKTKVTIRWAPYNASADEQKTFDTNHDSMRQGWGGSLDRLAEHLAAIQS